MYIPKNTGDIWEIPDLAIKFDVRREHLGHKQLTSIALEMSPRRATNNTPLIPTTYVQNLQQCVQRLQDSSSLLKASVKKIENSTRNFSRLRKLIACQRVSELVTEPEIREAQRSVAIQLEPRVKHLLLKAEELLTELEQRENILQEEVNRREIELDVELKRTQTFSQKQGNKVDHSGSSEKQLASTCGQRKAAHNNEHAKKLKEMKKKMERMAKSVRELEDECKHKRRGEFMQVEELQLQKQRIAAEKKPSAIKTPKKSKVKPKNDEVLENIEDQIKDLDVIIGEKREILDDQQNAIMEVSRDNETVTDEDFKWKQIQAQFEFLKRAEQQIESRFNWPNGAATEFEILCDSYLQLLENAKLETRKKIASQLEQKGKCIDKMQKLCRLLYPNDNIGGTIARLVEILLESKQKEIFVKDLGAEFPPEQKKRHHLQTAIATLNWLEVTETVLEDTNGLDNEGEMILKLKRNILATHGQSALRSSRLSYATHEEAAEARKSGFEQVNFMSLDVYARKPSSSPKPVMVVVSANYRLAPISVYPNQLIDIKRALRWIKTNIAAFGGDPQFVAVAGDDAGGQIAAVVALTPNNRKYQPNFESVDTSVNACVLINAITDLVDEKNLWDAMSIDDF
ncbi:14318_t:CDS:10, partial [Acaulospora colombiana]